MPSPPLVSIKTSWPSSIKTFTEDGVKPILYSLFFSSLGDPIFITAIYIKNRTDVQFYLIHIELNRACSQMSLNMYKKNQRQKK